MEPMQWVQRTEGLSLRAKMLVVAMLVGLFGGLAVIEAEPAEAAACRAIDQCSVSQDLNCAQGYQIRFRYETFDFAFTDSTGDTRFTHEIGSNRWNKYYYNVEHDGTTRFWYTGRRSSTYAWARASKVSSLGMASFSISCQPV